MINEQQRNDELTQMFRQIGINEVAITDNAATCDRGWIMDGQDTVAYWYAAIGRAIGCTRNGAAGSEGKSEVTILPRDNAIEEATNAHTKAKVVIQRIKFLIGIPGKKWLGAQMIGIGPSNEELALPDNWADA